MLGYVGKVEDNRVYSDITLYVHVDSGYVRRMRYYSDGSTVSDFYFFGKRACKRLVNSGFVKPSSYDENIFVRYNL